MYTVSYTIGIEEVLIWGNIGLFSRISPVFVTKKNLGTMLGKIVTVTAMLKPHLYCIYTGRNAKCYLVEAKVHEARKNVKISTADTLSIYFKRDRDPNHTPKSG